MKILYKRGYVEYHSSLYANVLKEYNLEVPGLRPAWAYIILLTKLRDILEDFLVGRSMRVKVGDVFSTIKFILFGVPHARQCVTFTFLTL